MIKNYLTYINESSKKYFSIIPDKILNDILDEVNYEDISVKEVNEFEENVRKLMVGKYCKFSIIKNNGVFYDYQVKAEGYVVKVKIARNSTFSSHLVTLKVKIKNGIFGKNYLLNGSQEIRIYDTMPTGVISNIDPYGEEDWEDGEVNEKFFRKKEKYIPRLIKDKVRRFTPEDPLGEEEWDD